MSFSAETFTCATEHTLANNEGSTFQLMTGIRAHYSRSWLVGDVPHCVLISWEVLCCPSHCLPKWAPLGFGGDVTYMLLKSLQQNQVFSVPMLATFFQKNKDAFLYFSDKSSPVLIHNRMHYFTAKNFTVVLQKLCFSEGHQLFQGHIAKKRRVQFSQM